jgi:hypothetical protein
LAIAFLSFASLPYLSQKTSLMKTFALIIVAFGFSLSLIAQSAEDTSEYPSIRATLMDYIEGTGKGEPERLHRAFHPDFNLYAVTQEDSLLIRDGEKYIADVKPGVVTKRIGKILAIDYVNNAAMAKVEIAIPDWRIFTDYFLLLKYEGSWKIVHKSYTWVPDAKKDE